MNKWSLTFILLGCLPVTALGLQEVRSVEEPWDREISARHTDMPITLDGILDEPIWAEVEPATDFIQREPVAGAPATEKTEMRIIYDDEALYFGVWAFDPEPGKLIINSLKQDFPIRNDDGVSFYIDTFNDDRNSFGFYINPVGAKRKRRSSMKEGMRTPPGKLCGTSRRPSQKKDGLQRSESLSNR